MGWGGAGGRNKARHLTDDHHRDCAASCLEDGNRLVVVDVDAGDAIDGDHLVVDPEAGLISRAASGHPRDENSLVVALERGRTKASSYTETQALVCPREGDLFRQLKRK